METEILVEMTHGLSTQLQIKYDPSCLNAAKYLVLLVETQGIVELSLSSRCSSFHAMVRLRCGIEDVCTFAICFPLSWRSPPTRQH
jgi:hypothetical protein